MSRDGIPPFEAIELIQADITRSFVRSLEIHPPLIRKYQDEIRTLKTQLEAVQSQQAVSAQNVKEFEARLEDMQSRHTVSLRNLTDLENQLEVVQSKVADLETKLGDSRVAHQLCQAEVEELRASREEELVQRRSTADRGSTPILNRPPLPSHPEPLLQDAVHDYGPEEIQPNEIDDADEMYLTTQDSLLLFGEGSLVTPASDISTPPDSFGRPNPLDEGIIPQIVTMNDLPLKGSSEDHFSKSENRERAETSQAATDGDVESEIGGGDEISSDAIRAVKRRAVEYDRRYASTRQSELRFIWDFIRGIDHEKSCAFVQGALLECYPNFVQDGVERRMQNSYRQVTISKELTWVEVSEVMRVL